jgi:TonB family protein
MTPLKETLEATTSVAEVVTPQVSERPKSDSGQLRADAVSLDVPVKVHGSRVTEVVRGITPHTEPFEEQTSTMIVFPQGGVLRMTTAVAAGQMVVLTNLKSGHDAICRVVKVRAYAQTQSYVELEFTNRQSGYWGVRFAGDEVEPVRAFVPPPPPPAPVAAIPPVERIEAKPAQGISWAPAANLQPQASNLAEPTVIVSPVKPVSPPVERIAPSNKPESSFVAIGAQEDVQPAAAATSGKKKIEKPATPVASLSMAELRGDVHVATPVSTSLGAGVPGEMTDISEDLAESSLEKAPATFGRLAAGAGATSAHSAPQKAFGARFDSTALGVSDEAAAAPKQSGPNWFLIATGIAAMFVVGAGAAFYFHVLPSAKPTSVSAPAAPPAALSTTSPGEIASSQPPASNSVAQVNQLNTPASTNNPSVAARAGDASIANANKDSAVTRIQASAPVSQKAAKVMPDMSATLNAHPVSAQRSASGDADAPSVDSGAASPNGELQGIGANSDVTPPPPPAAPVRIGGAVQAPKLVSTILPVYPAIARTNGVEGSVVIEASVGTNGSVVSTKVISGPPILRQAALDALRRWKYQPATLNGEPVAVQITVTLQFHK